MNKIPNNIANNILLELYELGLSFKIAKEILVIFDRFYDRIGEEIEKNQAERRRLDELALKTNNDLNQ